MTMELTQSEVGGLLRILDEVSDKSAYKESGYWRCKHCRVSVEHQEQHESACIVITARNLRDGLEGKTR